MSIPRVVEIISQYVSWGIKEFEFWDETFNPNIKRLTEFAHAIKQKRLKISFAIRGAVVSNVDYESIKNLKEAGLRRIQFGVESCTQRLLELMNKKITREQMRKAFSISNSLKIPSVANMMIGIPTQTEQEISEDMAFVWKLNPTYVSISVFTYAPHTQFYLELLEKENSADYWKNFAQNPTREVELRHNYDFVDEEKLFELQATFTKKYYSRLSYLWRYLFMAQPDEIPKVLRLGTQTLFSSSLKARST